ncbi:MAG: hypothetical protein KDD00_03980 [Ignavibacteriae bacterium]|nr:hypothetical protein [Ignavibacteriota bacterium]
MHKHHFWMIIGCILPIILIFLLPVFNISNQVTLFIIIILVFIGHFFMLGHHGKHSNNHNGVEKDHEHH